MTATWSEAASFTFTYLEMLTHEEYATRKRMWYNHISAWSASLSHAPWLLAFKWITDPVNQGQFVCWHDSINRFDKQTTGCLQAQGSTITWLRVYQDFQGREIKVLYQSWCHQWRIMVLSDFLKQNKLVRRETLKLPELKSLKIQNIYRTIQYRTFYIKWIVSSQYCRG